MNLPRFLALRLYKDEHIVQQMSRPAVLIAQIGIAIGLMVMIIAVAIIVGFKQEVREKIVGFGAHIQISNADVTRIYDSKPIAINDSLVEKLKKIPNVDHIQRYSTKAGMLKTGEAFQGILLKGVGEEYDLSFFRQHLIDGEIPFYNDTISSNEVLLSKTIADKMKLQVGDKVDTYYIQESVRTRRLQVVGIYETNLSEYDNLFLITGKKIVDRLNNWESSLASGAEILLKDYERLDNSTWDVFNVLEYMKDNNGNSYCVQNIKQLNPQMFAWLSILDVNIAVILVLMLGVAGFTMISGLLIIIIERTSMIGLLKSLGATNGVIRKTFLWFSVLLIGKGMMWGNIVGLGLFYLQKWTGIFQLDPTTYYMDKVPVSLSWWLFILLNMGTLVASVLMLIGPSYLVSRIHPAESMRYE